MNPIRIAPGPPTEPGWYWYRSEKSHRWVCIHVIGIGQFFIRIDDDGVERAYDLRQASAWQWSTRIPDPEE